MLLQFLTERVAERQARGAICIVIGNEDSVAAEPVTVGIFLSFVLPGFLQVIWHRVMMDGNEQVAMQIVSAGHTVEQTGHSRSARDQWYCFVEPCLVQRPRDHIGELEVEFVFWHAAGAVGAGRSRRVANINENAKRRSRATIAVSRVLRCSVLGAHRLPSHAGKHRGQSDNSKKGNPVDGHGSKLCDAAVSRTKRRFVETPRCLCTCFLAVAQTNITRQSATGRQTGAAYRRLRQYGETTEARRSDRGN